MSVDAQANAGTTAVRAAHRFDEQRLAQWLDQNVTGYAGPLSVEQFKGGHPLADFAYHAMMFHMPPDMVAGLGGADIAALGIPSEADYLAAYCERSGRPLISQADYDFYIAFNFFRIAAIFHGIKGRVVRGTAVSAHAKARAASLPRLIALARQSMEACQ